MTSKYGYFSEQEYIPPVALEGGKRRGSQQHKENATRPFRPVSGDHLGKVRCLQCQDAERSLCSAPSVYSKVVNRCAGE